MPTAQSSTWLADLRPDLGAYLRRLCLADGERAEELLAETTARLWEHRERIEALPPTDRRRYAFTVARNLFLDDARHRQRRESLPTGPAEHDAVGPTAEDTAIRRELVEKALRIVDDLGRVQQQSIRLRFFEGLDNSETARRLDLDPRTARVVLHRALKVVRARMGES